VLQRGTNNATVDRIIGPWSYLSYYIYIYRGCRREFPGSKYDSTQNRDENGCTRIVREFAVDAGDTRANRSAEFATDSTVAVGGTAEGVLGEGLSRGKHFHPSTRSNMMY